MTFAFTVFSMSSTFAFLDSSFINIAFTVVHWLSVTEYREKLWEGGGNSGLPNLGEGNKICVQTTSSVAIYCSFLLVCLTSLGTRVGTLVCITQQLHHVPVRSTVLASATVDGCHYQL